MPSAEEKTTYPWPFYVAVAATLLLFLSFQALFSTLPLYVVALGGSEADIGTATWVFALAAILTRPPAGSLADRWGRKPMLVIGAVLFGIAPLLYAFADSVPLLLLVRAIHGIGMALFSTTYQAFIAGLLSPKQYGEGLGLANAASVVTMTVAPLGGEWIERQLGFEALFWILGAVGCAGVVATIALPRNLGTEPGSRPKMTSQGIRLALRRPAVCVGSLGMALLGLPFGAFITFLPLMAEARGMDGVGWAFTAYAAVSSLAQPVGGRLADQWDVRGAVLAGLMLAGFSAVGLAHAAELRVLVILSGLFGAGHGAARVGLDTYVQRGVDKSSRGSAAAIQYTAFDSLVGFGSWGLGLLAGAMDYRVMYGATGGIVLVGSLIGLLASRRWFD